MKVLMINVHTDIQGGGAALGVTQLGASIQKKGVEIAYLSRDDFDFESKDTLPAGAEALFCSHLYSDIPTIVNKIQEIDPDVLHVNCIDRNIISLFDILRTGKPILWTVRDNTAHTGGCTFLYDCEKYKTGCHSCEYIKSEVDHDITSAIFDLKQRVYKDLKNIILVGPSNWMADNLRQSGITKEKEIRVIPNSIDLSAYFPEEKEKAKKALKLDPSKRYMLFGAHNIQNPRKGFSHIKQALELVKAKSKHPLELLTFGKNGENIEINGIKISDFGYVHGDEQKRLLYSACDLMLVPSLSEAFGKTVTEAMACGTPVVAFNTGGPADIIEHEKNGYLAKCFDYKDLANGMNWILNHEQYQILADLAVKRCDQAFNSEAIADRYIKAYKDLLAQDVQNNPKDYDKYQKEESLIKSLYEEVYRLGDKFEANFLRKLRRGQIKAPQTKAANNNGKGDHKAEIQELNTQITELQYENHKLRENEWVKFSEYSFKYKVSFLLGKMARKIGLYKILRPIKKLFVKDR